MKEIVIDAYGGDYSPTEIIKGAVLALKKIKDKSFKIILTGKSDEIKLFLSDYKYDAERIEVIEASEIISNNESPTDAIKNKKNSSLVVALDYLKQNENAVALISAGSTGAVLTGGFLKIGRIKGVSRPALAPLLPTKKESKTLLIDCGANMDCKPINLVHFAMMGSIYMQCLYGIEKPRVALLNVGVEDKKGNELCKEVFPLLKQININFVGNMEARDAFSGDYDVIVTDGFGGNVLLKTAEGCINLVTGEIKSLTKKSLSGLVGVSFMSSVFKKLKKKIDYTKMGGSPFLGIKKLIIKSHGSSKAKTILSCVQQALVLQEKNINQKIEQELEQLSIVE